MQRIQFVQAQRISVTQHSVNIIKEYRNYLWATDDDGKNLNEPEHTFSHSMDAVGYGLSVKMVLASKHHDALKSANAQIANLPKPPQIGMFPKRGEESDYKSPNNFPR